MLRKSFINAPKGELTLTQSALAFSLKGKELFNIALADITNSRAIKGIANGKDLLVISYQDQGQDKEIKLEHYSFVGFGMGNLSKVQALYFASWEQVIENARLKT